MGFKSDREFLRNVSVGAVGTRQILNLLNAGGYGLIDLDRGALSNKIWATKIKRLRVPDLLSLTCGVRIESRAKGELKIRMSHALNNPERYWDNGLRDDDLVAFSRCFLTDDVHWTPSPHVALFQVKHLRETKHLAKQSQMKSASEGSEVYLEWPAIIPSSAGCVVAVAADAIKVRMDSGRNQTYPLRRKRNGATVSLHPHVKQGDTFGEGDRIIASILPELAPTVCRKQKPYNFLADLGSSDRATTFAAVKALGFLPALKSKSEPRLVKVSEEHADKLVRLEALGALARLDSAEGWKRLAVILSDESDGQLRMEAVLLLSELNPKMALSLLHSVSETAGSPAELRSAAIWGTANLRAVASPKDFLPRILDEDEGTSLHALVALSRVVTDKNVSELLDRLGDDSRLAAGIVKAIELSPIRPVADIISRLAKTNEPVRSWLIFALCRFGRDCCEQEIRRHLPSLLPHLEFSWKHHNDNWTNRVDVLDQIDYLMAQLPT